MLQIVAVIIISCTILLAGAMVLPRLFGIVPYTVRTGSMEPALPVGALVYVNTHNKAAQTNDIIAFTVKNGVVVTHRVVAEQDGKFITKGDVNTAEDFVPVSAAQMLGIYVFHIPLIGYLFLIPAAKYLWLAITLGAIICFIILKKEGTPS